MAIEAVAETAIDSAMYRYADTTIDLIDTTPNQGNHVLPDIVKNLKL